MLVPVLAQRDGLPDTIGAMVDQPSYWCQVCDQIVPELFWLNASAYCGDCVETARRIHDAPLYMLTPLGRADQDGTFTFTPAARTALTITRRTYESSRR